MTAVVVAIMILVSKRRRKNLSTTGSSIYSGPYTNTAYSHSSISRCVRHMHHFNIGHNCTISCRHLFQAELRRADRDSKDVERPWRPLAPGARVESAQCNRLQARTCTLYLSA
jgi:hypothetical protein